MEKGNSRSFFDRNLRRNHSVNGICDLPDSILGHILSFLPTDNAVATSILSQRWKFLWTTISNLDFSCRNDKIEQSIRFVNHVLLLHKPGYLNRLTLTWYTKCNPYYVHTWISTAIARNVRELILKIDRELRSELCKLSIQVQRSMFSCESLQSLELSVRICISREIVGSLPKLVTLKLIRVSFESEETLCKLLGGCPVLKNLFLLIDMSQTRRNCRLHIGTEFKCIISSTSLRHLELFAIEEGLCARTMSICSVQVDAPSLNYIDLNQISSISISQSLFFLDEARVELWKPTLEDQIYYNSVAEAFRVFDCAKTLVLNNQVISVLSRAAVDMKTVFNKLTTLFVTKDYIYWSSLREFITMADNLEVFLVYDDEDDHRSSEWLDDEDNITVMEPSVIPRCLSNRLRFVLINKFDGHKDQFAMVSYILKHGSVLELMEIGLAYSALEGKCEMIQKICKLPRKSPVCEVEFIEVTADRISKIEGLLPTT